MIQTQILTFWLRFDAAQSAVVGVGYLGRYTKRGDVDHSVVRLSVCLLEGSVSSCSWSCDGPRQERLTW